MDLLPYQTAGVEWLAQRDVALLADEPGLGKSAQAIRAAAAAGCRRVLILCPASVKPVWRREVERWWPGVSVQVMESRRDVVFGDVVIANYDLVTDKDLVERLCRVDWDVLIPDEAHYLKSRDAKRTKAVYGARCDRRKGLAAAAKRVWLLTGTPTPNDPSEIWTHLRALCGLDLGYWDYVFRYCKTHDGGFGTKITGVKDAEGLRELVRPWTLRRKKRDVLTELPALRIDDLPLQVDDAARRALAQIEKRPDVEVLRQLVAKLEGGQSGGEGEPAAIGTVRRLIGEIKAEPCADWAREQLDGGLPKLVVMAYHRSVIEILAGALEDYGVAVLHGGVMQEKRGEVVRRFQEDADCRVFVGQVVAAGTGITLTAAADMLVVEMSWVPAENQQAFQRIHRVGQRNGCLVRLAHLPRSVDEQVVRALKRKIDMIKEIET